MTDSSVVDAMIAERVSEAEARQRLRRYVELIEEWSSVHNLVSFGDRRELVERHVLESLPLVEAMAEEGSLLDVGSGAGLPGVPLLVFRPRWQGVLMEPRQKRWAFLRLVIRELGLSAEVVAKRFQDWETSARFALITARALGGHDELLEWAKGRLVTGGTVAIFTGDAEAERLRRVPGWHVLSSALADLERGRLVRLEPCFT